MWYQMLNCVGNNFIFLVSIDTINNSWNVLSMHHVPVIVPFCFFQLIYKIIMSIISV